MRNKQVVTSKLETVVNRLTSLDSSMSIGKPIRDLKLEIEDIKEKLADIQTLVNNESDSWN
jgi:hypothetical protein